MAPPVSGSSASFSCSKMARSARGNQLRFLHSATISGRVLDSHGDPATYIAVTLLKLGRDFGERALVRYRVANSNDRGEYRLDDVAPGQYYLHADPSLGFASADHFVPQYPGRRAAIRGRPRAPHHPRRRKYRGVRFSHDLGAQRPYPRKGHRSAGEVGGADGIEIMISPADEYVENLWGLPQTAESSRLRVQLRYAAAPVQNRRHHPG